MDLKGKKIGIMGGTFNPIHMGHLNIAEAALKEYDLDQVWFMPNGCPPHKELRGNATDMDRATMVKLAIEDYPKFVFSDFEMNKDGKSYTYETLSGLKDDYPDTEFYFIMGGDSIDYFTEWVHPEIICQKAIILVAGRDDISGEKLKSKVQEVSEALDGDIRLIDCPNTCISSSQIRDLAAEDLKKFIPQKVLNYIEEQDLYD